MLHLKLLLLGSPQILLDDIPVHKLGRTSGTAVLAYLAVHNKAIDRAQLHHLLWPDLPEKKAQVSLRRTLYDLKKYLGAGFVQSNRQQVQLGSGSQLYCDVHHFEQALASCPTHSCTDQCICAACLPQHTAVAQLYREDFLTGFDYPYSTEYEAWQRQQTAYFHNQMRQLLQRLSHSYAHQNDTPEALRHAHRWLSLDPLDETAVRQLMTLYAQSGQRNQALAQYHACTARLQDYLGLIPTPETLALYEMIKQGEIVSDATANTAPPSYKTKVTSAKTPDLPLTPFLGRQAELAQIEQLLLNENCRLITLVGLGGSGKTRLALQVLEQYGALFGEGTAVIFLSHVTQADYLVPAILDGLNLELHGRAAPQEQLINYLRHKKTLLVLDNFEQLLTAVDNITYILQQTNVKLIITSRRRLNLSHEWLIDVAGLTYPATLAPPHKSTSHIELAQDNSAVQLFVQTAQRQQPRFQLTPTNNPAIIRICHLVEGLPLAIELAATWIRTLTPTAIVAEIERNLDFLSTRSANQPPRHRSLRIIFEQSWKNLTPNDQQTALQLGLMPASFSRAAAEHIVPQATLSSLANLVDNAFLRLNSEGLFRMHEQLRQFLLLQASATEQEEIYQRIAAYYAHFIAQQEPRLHTTQVKEALHAVATQFESIRYGWLWAANHQAFDLLEMYLGGLTGFLKIRSRFLEGEHLLSIATTAVANIPTPTKQTKSLLAKLHTHQAEMSLYLGQYDQVERLLLPNLTYFNDTHQGSWLAFTYRILGLLAHWRGQTQTAYDYLNHSLDIATELNNRQGMSIAHGLLGIWHHDQSNFDQASYHHKTSFNLYQQIGHQLGLSTALSNLGHLANAIGNYHEARERFAASLVADRALGGQHNIAISLNNLGIVASNLGDTAAAWTYYEESLGLRRIIGDRQGEARVLGNLGAEAYEQQRYEQAQKLLHQSWEIYEELDYRLGMAQVLSDLGSLACEQERWGQARHYLERSLTIYQELTNDWGEASTLSELGRVAICTADYDSAYTYLQQAIDISRQTTALPVLADAMLQLGEWYRLTDQLEYALFIFAVTQADPAATNYTRSLAEEKAALVAQLLPPDIATRQQQKSQQTSLLALAEMSEFVSRSQESVEKGDGHLHL